MDWRKQRNLGLLNHLNKSHMNSHTQSSDHIDNMGLYEVFCMYIMPSSFVRLLSTLPIDSWFHCLSLGSFPSVGLLCPNSVWHVYFTLLFIFCSYLLEAYSFIMRDKKIEPLDGNVTEKNLEELRRANCN